MRKHLAALISVGISMLSRLGRRLGYPAPASMPISAAILDRLATVSVDQSLEDVAQLLVAGRSSQIPILDGGKPVGVVTRDDLAAGVQVLGPHALVAEAPHRGVVTVSPSDSLADVYAQLRAAPEAVAVVVDRGTPVGMITFEHLLAYLDRARLGDRAA